MNATPPSKGQFATWIQTANPMLLVLAFGLAHLSMSLVQANFVWHDYMSLHNYLDSKWYQILGTQGYLDAGGFQHEGAQYAFLPLWPLVINALSMIIPSTHTQVAGAFLALLLFFLTFKVCHWFRNNPVDMGIHQRYLNGGSFMGMLPLVIAPGAWVFFSNHTESLFLLTSILALNLAYRGHLLTSSILAGLCALTRNQGVLVAATVGLVFLCQSAQPFKTRGLRFLASGALSGCFYLGWLGFLYQQTGNVFASADAQVFWTGASPGFSKYFSNLFWLSPGNGLRAFWLWCIVISSIVLFFKQRNNPLIYPIVFYMLSSVLLWPLQGHSFAQAYRFGAVIFPFWFMVGHWLEQRLTHEKGRKRFMALASIGALLVGTIKVSYSYYVQSGWPY